MPEGCLTQNHRGIVNKIGFSNLPVKPKQNLMRSALSTIMLAILHTKTIFVLACHQSYWRPIHYTVTMTQMKLVVCGGHFFTYYRRLEQLFKSYNNRIFLVHHAVNSTVSISFFKIKKGCVKDPDFNHDGFFVR